MFSRSQLGCLQYSVNAAVYLLQYNKYSYSMHLCMPKLVHIFHTSTNKDSSVLPHRKFGLSMTHLLFPFLQRYIQSAEAEWSVSLRDIKRWLMLFDWFWAHLKNRPLPVRGQKKRWGWMEELRAGGDDELMRRSVVLALALCYYVRLGTPELRSKYTEQVTNHLWLHHVMLLPHRFERSYVT